MNLSKISNFIKSKRKELGITQEELANRLFVTEKAISRWETGRGTPDISLLIPLSQELKVNVSELLNGEDNIETLINYTNETKKNKNSFYFKFTIFLYSLSIFIFLVYLRFEYNPSININYFIRLIVFCLSSLLIFTGNKIYADNYVEKIDDKLRFKKLSLIIIFVYYIIFIFNMVFFARYTSISSYNLVPFKTIFNIISNDSLYVIIINIFGNLLIFMPLEYFIIELFKIRKFTNCFLISFLIILFDELMQFIFKVGVLDIDDLILNMIGMMIFYFIYNKFLRDNSCLRK